MGKSLKLIIEALLFASDKPLNVRDIRVCLPDAKPSEIKSAILVLKHEYETMGRSFSLKEIAGGYQLRSHSDYGPYILKMLQNSPDRLSKAAMETLAIVAYKQPILRHEIERLRGVDVGGILRTLMEKDLIKVMGRKELPGRPLIYGTTKKFLAVFELKDIDALPSLKEMQALGSDELDPAFEKKGDTTNNKGPEEDVTKEESTDQSLQETGSAGTPEEETVNEFSREEASTEGQTEEDADQGQPEEETVNESPGEEQLQEASTGEQTEEDADQGQPEEETVHEYPREEHAPETSTEDQAADASDQRQTEDSSDESTMAGTGDAPEDQ